MQCLAITPDGRQLATAAGDQTVKLWDVTDGRQTASFDSPDGPVTMLCVSGSVTGVAEVMKVPPVPVYLGVPSVGSPLEAVKFGLQFL